MHTTIAESMHTTPNSIQPGFKMVGVSGGDGKTTAVLVDE